MAALAEPEAEAQNYYRSLVTGRDYYRPNPSTKYEAVSPYYGFDTQYQGYTYWVGHNELSTSRQLYLYLTKVLVSKT